MKKMSELENMTALAGEILTEKEAGSQENSKPNKEEM